MNEVPYTVGDVVSGVITALADDGGLWLDVDGVIGHATPDRFDPVDGKSARNHYADGVIGYVTPDELDLVDGESTRDRYPVGDTAHDLFVLWVGREERILALSVRRNAPGYVEALSAHSAGDVVSATVTAFGFGDRGLWLDIGGVIGYVLPREMLLADGKSAQDRYAVGDIVHNLFIWQIDHNERDLSLSIQRNAPGYMEALNSYGVGDIVSATVTGFQDNGGLWLDVDGVIGGVAPWELPLTDDESAHDRYAVGDTVDDLFVWQVNRDTRRLSLSVRRNVPGYVEALNVHRVGDVVSATITGFQGNGGLWLDVGGVIGVVAPKDLPLVVGGSVQDHYAVGDTVDDLFIWQVDHDDRTLDFSARRNAPGYVEALNTYRVGDVVSATVIVLASDGGLWLDVDGVLGCLAPDELSFTDGECARDHYPLGHTVHDLFVWQVNHDSRDLDLSARRSAPGYVEALNAHSVGQAVSAIVTAVQDNGGLWLDVGRVIGWAWLDDLPLANSESAQDRYAVDDSVEAHIWQINQESRYVVLLVRDLG